MRLYARKPARVLLAGLLYVGLAAGAWQHGERRAFGGGGPAADPGPADLNADGLTDISDAVYLLNYLFLGGPPPSRPKCPPPATGATRCSNQQGEEVDCGDTAALGQDAVYQAGCSAGFRDNGDGTVTDRCTGLLWQKVSGTTAGMVWEDALRYAESLILCRDGTWTTDPAEVSAHGGVLYDDWRLPNARELGSIVDYGRFDSAANPVFEIAPAGYWTSTPAASDPAKAWCVHFYEGVAEPVLKEAHLQVVVVRGPVGR